MNPLQRTPLNDPLSMKPLSITALQSSPTVLWLSSTCDTIKHFVIVQFTITDSTTVGSHKIYKGVVFVCKPCGFAPGPSINALAKHTHGSSWARVWNHYQKKREEIGEIIDPETFASKVLPHLDKVPPYDSLAIEDAFACSECPHKTVNRSVAIEHRRDIHEGRSHYREVKVQTFYRGQKTRNLFIVTPNLPASDSAAHSSGSTDDIRHTEAPNPLTEGCRDCNHNLPPINLAAHSPQQKGLREAGCALGIGLTKGTTSIRALESLSRATSPGGGQNIAQENGSHASLSDTPHDIEQETDLPFSGVWDPESKVPIYRPSEEQLSDFGHFIKTLTENGSFNSIGVALVKVPTGSLNVSKTVGFASRRGGNWVSYYMQSSTVIEGTDNQVFRINHTPRTRKPESEWNTQTREAIERNGETVDMQKMVDMFTSSCFKASYMSNLEGFQLSGNALTGAGIPGMSTDFIYIGTPGSITGIHKEDLGIISLNYNHQGHPKDWRVIDLRDQAKFEDAIEELPPRKNRDCSQFVQHQNLFVCPQFLKRKGICYRSILQEEGTMVVVHGEAYHQVVNTGWSIAVANNFAQPETVYWLNYIQCSTKTCGENKGWSLAHGKDGQLVKIFSDDGGEHSGRVVLKRKEQAEPTRRSKRRPQPLTRE
ncbi:MAG: hypothetical protein M1840_000832 [Geoglossum simile]|nr:MAG: hypothetical protein M1840_000832 [Geoglossum simile]